MYRTTVDGPHARYRSLALQSEIERADPHGLVLLLYDELALCIDVLAIRAKTGERLTDDRWAHKARSIILALRSGLDFGSAADLAQTLDALYAALATELEERLAAPDPARLAELRTSVETLREAWRSISG